MKTKLENLFLQILGKIEFEMNIFQNLPNISKFQKYFKILKIFSKISKTLIL